MDESTKFVHINGRMEVPGDEDLGAISHLLIDTMFELAESRGWKFGGGSHEDHLNADQTKLVCPVEEFVREQSAKGGE